MAKKPKLDFDPSIDENALDVEWLKQPGLYFTWAKRLADARLAVDRAEQAVDLARAEADSRTRRNPNAKATEKAVEAAVTRDPSYIEALEAYHRTKHAAAVLAAAVTALDHRKKALEKLVELQVREYFSEPRTNNPRAREAMETRTARRIHGVRPRPETDD